MRAALRDTVMRMSGRDSSRGSNPDDWFGREATVEDWGQPADDWLDDEPAAGGGAPAGGGPVGRRRVALAVGAAAIVLLVVGLAVGGVFSGGGQSPTTTATTAPAATTSPTTPVQPKPAAPPAPATTLKPGDQGAQVKVLQRALVALGYAPGAIDGDYGSSTQAAVTRFQRASALAADGVLGPKTLAALKLALLNAQ
jgi:lysozyme family protein